MKDSEDGFSDSSCFQKFYTCANIKSFFNAGQIHPLDTVNTSNNHYINIDHDKRIRVIHVCPKTSGFREKSVKLEKRVSRSSLSDEYWFTQWGKPLRNNPCKCSFRRSARFSRVSTELGIFSSQRPDSSNKQYKKCNNLDTFVELFIQETIKSAYKEFSKRAKSIDEIDKVNISTVNITKQGLVNKAFVPAESDIIQEEDIHVNGSINNVEIRKKNCVHSLQNKTKQKPLVFLLHGIGSSADVWWSIINKLQNNGYEIIAPDMLGHGFSSVPNQSKEYTFKNLLKITLSVLENYLSEDPSRKCILIGHSFGCSLATALYKYKSQQISQMVLISGGGPTPLVAAVRENMTLFSCLQTMFKPLLFCGMKRSVFYSARGKHFVSCEENDSIPEYVLQYIANGQNWSEGDSAYHRRILVPTLLVHGLQDNNVTLVQECEMERTIPRSFLELIPNAGHIAMLDSPEQLSHMILCFVEWWSN